MGLFDKNLPGRCYAALLRRLAPFYLLWQKVCLMTQSENRPKNIVLLITRGHDVELLVGPYQKAQRREDLCPSLWLVGKCLRREPKILHILEEKNMHIDLVIDFLRLGTVMKRLLSTDAFLSTVETTSARHKLPYIITGLANAFGIPTFTLQHGFENVGLTYHDDTHGTDVKFSSKTVLTWGPKEVLPVWVAKETRDKCIAVGCPKDLFANENVLATGKGARQIIGVFDNLHWRRYDEKYVSTFLEHLEETARQQKDLHFVLKSHPESVRTRTADLTARLRSMKEVTVADLSGKEEEPMTTPWLLTHALGVITTPSTIALDAALAKVPVAVTRYGLDLDYYTPLSLIDSLADWQSFTTRLKDNIGNNQLKLHGEEFLSKVLVAGDSATKILDVMVRSTKGRNQE